MAAILDREEYIEQAYFFHVLRERLAANMATQDVLERVHEEILATTRLPYAIQFIATEVKHTGLLSSGFSRLPHYFLDASSVNASSAVSLTDLGKGRLVAARNSSSMPVRPASTMRLGTSAATSSSLSRRRAR